MSRNIYNSVGGHSNPCSSNSCKDRAFPHGRSDINGYAKTFENDMYKSKKTLNNTTNHSTIIKLDFVEPTDNRDVTQLRNTNTNREIAKPDFYDQYLQYANYYFNAKKEIGELKLELHKCNRLKEEMAVENEKFQNERRYYYKMNSDIVRLEKEKNNLFDVVKDIPVLETNIEELHNVMDESLEKNKNLTNENTNLKNQISELKEKFRNSQDVFDLECKQLKSEIDNLKRNLSKWSFPNEDLNNTVAKLEKEKNDICKEARERISELETYIKDLKYAVTKLEKEKNDQFNEAKQIISKLETEIETQKHHLKILNEEKRSLINENNKRSPNTINDSYLNDTIAKLEEEKNKMRNAAPQKISELEKKIEGLELHVKTLDEEKTNLLKEKNKSSRRIVTDSSKFASLPQFCDNSGVRNSEVSKSESKEENNDYGLRYNSEEIIKLIEDLNQSKYRYRDYRKKYNECKTLNEKLKTDNSNYDKEISQLKVKLDDLTISTREVSNWNTERDHTTTGQLENRKLQDKTPEIQSSSHSQNTSELEIKIMNLEEANQKYVIMIAEKDSEIQKKKDAILTMHEKFKSNKNGNEELEKLNQYKIQVATLQKQLDGLKEQFDQLTDLYRDTTVQFEVSKKLNNELKAEINNMKLLQFAKSPSIHIRVNDEIFQEKNTADQNPNLKVKVAEKFPSWWSDHMKPVSIEKPKLKECPNCNRTISDDSMSGHIKLCMDI